MAGGIGTKLRDGVEKVVEKAVSRVIVARGKREPEPGMDRRGAISKSLSEDNWNYGSGPNAVIEPPFKPNRVCEQVNVSQSLRPVRDAVVTNVHLMGHTWVPLRIPKGDAQIAEAEKEKRRLERWFRSCNRLGWPEMRKRFGTDKETIAYALFEILRNLDGQPCGLSHRPSRTFRMTSETDPVEATFRVFDDESGDWVEIKAMERFRRWVQNVGGQLRYFREFGDPRWMDCRTGDYLKNSDGTVVLAKEIDKVPEDKRAFLANEVIWQCTYDPMSEYGIPWFMGLWNDTESDYYAADATRDYLADGAIPRVIFWLLASQLTKGSAALFKSAFEGVKGKHAENAAILLEAAPMVGKAEGPGGAPDAKTPGFHVTKLNDLQQGDALFREFRKDHHRRVRIARRLPGLFVGEDDQANFATADIQVQMGTSQLFRPEQSSFDDMLNGSIVSELNAVWWRFKSLGPTLEDNGTWVDALRIAIESGAIPDYPTLRRVLSEVLGYELPSGKDGQLAEWEQMPPGFVAMLFKAIQGFPQFADLADTLPIDSPAKGAEGGAQTTNRSVVARSAVVERLADMFREAAIKTRERLAAEAAGGGE